MFSKTPNKVLIKRRRPNNQSTTIPPLTGGELFMDENKITLFYGASGQTGIVPIPIAGSVFTTVQANSATKWENDNKFYQLGLDIDGEAALDQSGYSVSINAAGDIVAIGAVLNDGTTGNSNDNRGHVRIYKFINGSWIQQGLDIDGEFAGDQSGYSVSINAAGDIVAIGAIFNDGTTGNLNDNRGHVRVYKFINGSWVQQGLDIDGEAAGDRSGWSVSLNAAGDIVAIGAVFNDGTTGDSNDNRGHVRVYKFINGSWIQQGLDIDGEAAGDQSGRSVSINAAGDIVAIGAVFNDGTTGDSNDNRGHVRVYKFINGSWIQQGLDIDGEFAGDQSGYSVSINAAGDIVAIGAYFNDGTTGISNDNRGHVRIYKFINGSWVQQGNDIDGEASGDRSGWSVSINAAGDIVAIGAYLNDGTTGNSNDNRGHVRVYKFINGSWIQQGIDIDGEAALDQSGWSVSLNAAGDIVAIGAVFNDGTTGNINDDRGHVRVYTNKLTYISDSYKTSNLNPTVSGLLTVVGDISTTGRILSGGIDIHTLFGTGNVGNVTWDNISNKPDLVENQGGIFGIKKVTEIEYNNLQNTGGLIPTTLYVIV
jgi:hypothetical protein